MTAKPSRASRSAMARPIPLLAPVTRMDLAMLAIPLHDQQLHLIGLMDREPGLGGQHALDLDAAIERAHHGIAIDRRHRNEQTVAAAEVWHVRPILARPQQEADLDRRALVPGQGAGMGTTGLSHVFESDMGGDTVR